MYKLEETVSYILIAVVLTVPSRSMVFWNWHHYVKVNQTLGPSTTGVCIYGLYLCNSVKNSLIPGSSTGV